MPTRPFSSPYKSPESLVRPSLFQRHPAEFWQPNLNKMKQLAYWDLNGFDLDEMNESVQEDLHLVSSAI